MTITINNQELDIINANSISSGHGHKKVLVNIHNLNTGQSKTFTSVSNNMRAFDEIQSLELEGEEKYVALYEIIATDIQEQLEEFVSPLV